MPQSADSSTATLPDILAGPIVRRLSQQQLALWLVGSRPLTIRAELYRPGDAEPFQSTPLEPANTELIAVGERAYIHLIRLPFDQPLDAGCLFEYDLRLDTAEGERGLADLQPWLLYDGQQRPSLMLKSRLDRLLHGSCRKPHYPGEDALLQADRQLALAQAGEETRPALLMMSGDQIYADDVAGPMLVAIHRTIELLGLWPEQLDGALVADSAALQASEHCYYRREELLPHDKASATLEDRFFAGVRKPIFTSDSAHNHLITLAEVIAMYLLVWSPVLWQRIDTALERVPDDNRQRFLNEQREIKRFAEGLPQVQRLMAQLPVYMIFDDHDITDDWNLTRGWEETAYNHPFSRRIIGNALIGYWLCQGWGNDPERFDATFISQLQRYFQRPEKAPQDQLIDVLLEFDGWGYSVPSQPKMVVLDTRTRRWWSESSAAKPSGLMDWEALSELQQELIGEPAVLLVSPAPIFGVKLIETVQRMFTYFGHALLVDAENWMAHPGSANVILNIFSHPKTPQHFVILSGDVHYSFAYDIRLRRRKNSPAIWQITCSGLKNEFPRRLLRWFDRINSALYSSRSPLNWFTKRRQMRIKARRPVGNGEARLLNGNGIGLLQLDRQGRPVEVSVLQADGRQTEFVSRQRAETKETELA
ncbi:alkaline phosphatase D family protein [Marinobacterium arenosum]|uniref:alkaline phosphatase D family protein n=1 Tax=Marinobacterium arenosum TaxID=2862496 RepID=UPI001C95E9EC|nr:alkaline phosphatase D family protein [Marinobacterium arenosum]MBY4675321.1 alkaline phosphatase family protein [Marinobacterium arenosum]